MNNRGMLTTKQELVDRNYWEYETLKKEGSYTLHLDFRSWAKSNGMICYFTDYTTDEFKKVKLFCWRHGSIYNPKQSKIDMSCVEDNTFWDIEVKNNKKGNAEWITAERCIWDLPDFDERQFDIIDELLIQAPDEFGQNDAVTEQYLDEHPELRKWMEE